MNYHVALYYANKMKSINTGNPMVDYCMKDVYIPLMMANM